MHHSCGTSALGNIVVVPRLLPDLAMALARLRSPAGDWHTSTHARYTRLTRHRERHTGKALVLTHVHHCFCSDAQQQPPSTERDERERDEREDADD